MPPRTVTPARRSSTQLLTGAPGAMGIGQRRAHGHGRMLPQRIERLEGLPGWAWNVVDARWETSFAALAAYADAHGHSYPPRTANLRLNQWVIGLRRPGQRQRLREDQRKRLEDLPGWSWAHRQTRQWESYFEELAAYAAAHATPARRAAT